MGNSEARLHKMGGQENKKKLDKQVKAIESRINQLEVKERPKEEKAIELSMPENRKIHSKILIRSEKLNKRFGDKVIFNNAKLEIENNRKIALLGINGSGIESITKQYLYQLAYQKFITGHAFEGVENCFLMPTEGKNIIHKGEASMQMLSALGLQNIKVRFLPAEKVFEHYLSGRKMEISMLEL